MVKDSKKEIKFEDALIRLEGIVQKLEEEENSLDSALKLFEEGVKLSGYCSKKLDEVKKKIEIIVKNEGKISTESFDMEQSVKKTEDLF